MTKVIPFPGIYLTSNTNARNTNARYAFTPEEILAFVTTHLAWQICEPTTPPALISVGVSDEGDGWLYCQKEIHRTGWSDTTPLCRFEKDDQGVRGTFFRKVMINGVEFRPSQISKDTLNKILDQRMRSSQRTIQRMLEQVHLSVADELASEIRNSFLPRISVNRFDSDALNVINYDAVERMYAVFDEAASAAVRDMKSNGTLDG